MFHWNHSTPFSYGMGEQRIYQQNADRAVIMGRRRVRLVVEGLPDVVPSTRRAGTQRVSHSDHPAVYAAPAPSGYSRIEHDAVATAPPRPSGQSALSWSALD